MIYLSDLCDLIVIYLSDLCDLDRDLYLICVICANVSKAITVFVVCTAPLFRRKSVPKFVPGCVLS